MRPKLTLPVVGTELTGRVAPAYVPDLRTLERASSEACQAGWFAEVTVVSCQVLLDGCTIRLALTEELEYIRRLALDTMLPVGRATLKRTSTWYEFCDTASDVARP